MYLIYSENVARKHSMKFQRSDRDAQPDKHIVMYVKILKHFEVLTFMSYYKNPEIRSSVTKIVLFGSLGNRN